MNLRDLLETAVYAAIIWLVLALFTGGMLWISLH